MQRWFADGEINITVNAIDRHVDAGRGDEPAMHSISSYTGQEQTLTYNQLKEQVGKLASVMKK